MGVDRELSGSRESAHRLPTELYLLFVGPEEPSWTLLTLQLDRFGCTRPRFHWCGHLADAARVVNQERFECIIVDDATPASADIRAGRDAPLLASLSALRTGGCLDPILVLSDRVDDNWLAEMADADSELLVTRQGWRSPALVPWIRCTIERHTLAREQHEIGLRGRDRQEQESSEAQRVLKSRSELVQRLRGDDPSTEPRFSEADRTFLRYRDVLRSVVLSDGHDSSGAIEELAGELADRGLTSVDILDLHSVSVATLLRGLGGRSARHVLQRTDLIGLEMLVRFGENCGPFRGFRAVRDSGLELSRDD